MNLRNLLIIGWLVFFASLLPGQHRVGDWQSFTSMMHINDLRASGDTILAGTDGGLLLFDRKTSLFDLKTNIHNLTHTVIEDLARDLNGRYWLAMGTPKGDINLWDLQKGLHQVITLGQTQSVSITRLAPYQDQVFGIASRELTKLVIHYSRLVNDEYEYKDFYDQFPVDLENVRDIAVFQDHIYLATDVGLVRTVQPLSAVPNLKTSSAWEQVQNTLTSTPPYHLYVREDTLVIAGTGSLWEYSGGSLSQQSTTGLAGKIEVLTEHQNTRYLGTTQGLFRKTASGWERVGNLSVPVTAVDWSVDGNIWVGTSRFGLAVYDPEDDSWKFWQPNTPFSNQFTAMTVSEDGQLIAANDKGIAILEDGVWRNILNYAKMPSADRAAIHLLLSDGFEDGNPDYWIADTMSFRAARPYNVVIRGDGRVFISHEGAGVTAFQLNNLRDYTQYDTTDGHLSGSEGIGGGTPTFIVTRDVTLDNRGVVWIANAFAANGNALAAMTPRGEWMHFSLSDDVTQGILSNLSTEIAVDNQNRIWIGSSVKSQDPYSQGGIAVLNYANTLQDTTDDTWHWVSKAQGLSGMSISSISITPENRATVVTDGETRIQSYRIPDKINSINDIYFSADIFEEHLSNFPIVDSEADVRSNVWFISANNGVKMRKVNGELLNSAQGYNTTNTPLLSDNLFTLTTDPLSGVVYFSTEFGISAVTTPFADSRKNFSDLIVFPSPFYIPSQSRMVVDGLPDDSEVKILTVNGQVIRTLSPSSGEVRNRQAFWNGRNTRGDLVETGVYFLFCYTQDGSKSTTKALVIRE